MMKGKCPRSPTEREPKILNWEEKDDVSLRKGEEMTDRHDVVKEEEDPSSRKGRSGALLEIVYCYGKM